MTFHPLSRETQIIRVMIRPLVRHLVETRTLVLSTSGGAE